MGNLCDALNNNVKFYYSDRSSFNLSYIQQLDTLNYQVLAGLNRDEILISLNELFKIVDKFNVYDKVIFFNRYINTSNCTINITKLCADNAMFNTFTNFDKNIESYYITLNILRKSIAHSSKKHVCGFHSKYNIVDTNFNFTIDSILLTLANLINYKIINKTAPVNQFKDCTHCNHTGYYNISGVADSKEHFCKLHKSINMKCINLLQSYDDIEAGDDSLCIICMSNDRNMIFTPCGHIIMCKLCYNTGEFTKCCICTRSIDNCYKLYF